MKRSVSAVPRRTTSTKIKRIVRKTLSNAPDATGGGGGGGGGGAASAVAALQAEEEEEVVLQLPWKDKLLPSKGLLSSPSSSSTYKADAHMEPSTSSHELPPSSPSASTSSSTSPPRPSSSLAPSSEKAAASSRSFSSQKKAFFALLDRVVGGFEEPLKWLLFGLLVTIVLLLLFVLVKI
jgi:hypothetical protein